MPHYPSIHRLDTQRSGLLIVDLQERLVPVVPNGDAVVEQSRRLMHAANLLSVPVAATVQYPQGLGQLVSPIANLVSDLLSEESSSAGQYEPEQKQTFSAAACRHSLDQWANEGRDQIVVAGIETHICVLQTVLDLLAEGQDVYVVIDAVAARHSLDHEVAIKRMVTEGATVTTVESIFFEWLQSADHPKFKLISQLVKESDLARDR